MRTLWRGAGGAGAALLRAVRGLCQATGGGLFLAVEETAEEPWASLTFSGSRHRLDLRLEGGEEEVEAVRARLLEWQEEEAPILAGSFLAEVGLTELERRFLPGGHMSLGLRIEALTIEE